MCTKCGGRLEPVYENAGCVKKWECRTCGFSAEGNLTFIDLYGVENNQTADHYSFQWGDKYSFGDFIKENKEAAKYTPAYKLGWNTLFGEIRQRAECSSEPITILDAACGFCGIVPSIFNDDISGNLHYLGVDIQDNLESVDIKKYFTGSSKCDRNRFLLIRHDISNPIPVEEKFDYVISRAALHHTPDPQTSFRSICKRLKSGGRIAISVYNRKALFREILDDNLRDLITKMPVEEAVEVSEQFTHLGRCLQEVNREIVIEEDLPFFGIEKGTYNLQEFIYYNFLKCYYNEVFGQKYSTMVNFDWYHPQFAFRYRMQEIEEWFAHEGITIIEKKSTQAQNYILGQAT